MFGGLFHHHKFKNKYGWKPDLPDQRDLFYHVIKPKSLGGAGLPPLVDLRPMCSQVEHQGNVGSCTGQALVAALEFLERKNNKPFEDLSRLFVYYNERVLEGTANSDSGAMIRDGLKTLSKDGVCSEVLWPYVERNVFKKPGCSAYADAKNHLVQTYFRIGSIDDMFACLASGYPFVFGATIYSGFENGITAKAGIVSLPSTNEQVMGGHAILCVGYDMNNKTFIVRNSWGTGWGDKGYCYFPFGYLVNPNLCDDFWTIRAATGF